MSALSVPSILSLIALIRTLKEHTRMFASEDMYYYTMCNSICMMHFSNYLQARLLLL
jgi:NO-binding membrane sensor protein with MHYT domain